LNLTQLLALMKDIRDGMKDAKAVGDDPDSPVPIAYPYSNLLVLTKFINSYFQQDMHDRAVTVDENCLKRFLKLPSYDNGSVLAKDNWIVNPILEFRWNTEHDLVKKMANEIPKMKDFLKKKMTLDEFVTTLIAKQKPEQDHPLNQLVTDGGVLSRPLFDVKKANMENVKQAPKNDPKGMVRHDFNGFEELATTICKSVVSYMKEGVMGKNIGDGVEKTDKERLLAVSGLGTTIAHVAMFQAGLLDNPQITPPPNLSQSMERLLKGTFGIQDSKRKNEKNEKKSLVTLAKGKSAFGLALDNAPQVVAIYGNLMTRIIEEPNKGRDRENEKPYNVDNYFQSPQKNQENKEEKWSSSSFDRIVTEAGQEMQKSVPNTYQTIASMMQPLPVPPPMLFEKPKLEPDVSAQHLYSEQEDDDAAMNVTAV
jgi:hypothetical protein